MTTTELVKSHSSIQSKNHGREMSVLGACLEVKKLEFILRLKIKCNDWLLADTCPQAANHCPLF